MVTLLPSLRHNGINLYYVTPPPPFVAQWGPGADKYTNDCGPAALAMALRWMGHSKQFGTLLTLTPDQISRSMNKRFSSTTTTSMITNVAKNSYGVSLEPLSRKEGLTPVRVVEEIKKNRPVISLVNYKTFGQYRVDKDVEESHFVLVIGIGEDQDENVVEVRIHDPLGTSETGRNVSIPYPIFAEAVRITPGNSLEYQGVVFSDENFIPPLPSIETPDRDEILGLAIQMRELANKIIDRLSPD